MRAIILANSHLADPESLVAGLREDDLIIAADGGGQHCLDLGLTPAVIIGDFDSLAEKSLEILEKRGAKAIRHSRRKDETDLELAVRYACRAGAAEILIFAALGNRWDMTLSNLLLPAQGEFQCVPIRLVDGSQQISLLKPGRTHIIAGAPGDTLSLIPLTDEATGIQTEALEYPLHGETLYFGSPRGVSNVFLSPQASITLQSGLLLCVHIRQSGALAG